MIPANRQYILMIALALIALVALGCDTSETSDYYGPQVFSVSPPLGSEAVVLNSVVAVAFNEVLEPASVNVNSFLVNSIGITATQVVGNVTVASNTATFTPDVNLLANTPYVAMLTTDIADQHGNPMDVMYSWYFITNASAGKPLPFTGRAALGAASSTAGELELFEYDGKLYIAESSANRVYVYDSPNAASAGLVFGQPNFYETAPSSGINGLDSPVSVVVHEGRIIVSDAGNNRLLIWNSLPYDNGAPADVVLGQPDFNVNSPACGPSVLNNPGDLFIMDGKLGVSDRGNNRVLIWQDIPTVNGAPADMVQGQPDMYSCQGE